MDIIQTAATIALLTLLAYFIMVNILAYTERTHAIKSSGHIKHTKETEEGTEGTEGTKVAGISNRLIEGINTNVGVHSRTTVGEPVAPGGENVTQLAVYNDKATGVLPVNHDLYEKPAEFGSDVTNINQFYRNNPEIFEKSMTTAPDADMWHNQSQDMFRDLVNQAPNTQIHAWNFEHNPGANQFPATPTML